jgi:hypothetical protein
MYTIPKSSKTDHHKFFRRVRKCNGRRKVYSSHIRHSLLRETLITAYVGQLIYFKTQNKDLVNKIHQFGLAISYTQQFATGLANSVVALCAKFSVLCTQSILRNVFTVAAFNNIDHNLTVTSSTSSFHRTSLLLYKACIEYNTDIAQEALHFQAIIQ